MGAMHAPLVKIVRRRRPRRVPITMKMWPDICLLWNHMTGTFRRRPWVLIAATLLVLLGIACLLLPQDREVLRALQLKHVPDRELRQDLKELSGEIGQWGDFAGYNLVLVVGLWIGGRAFRSRYFQRLAVASMLCAIFAGAVANVFRFSVGRPRPKAIEREGIQDGAYGPRVDWNYNSFPSGHTATAFGSAVPLAIAMPPVGVPALIGAGGVCWARMYGNQHHPSDVAVAIWLAVLFGVPLGLAVRRTRFTKDEDGPDGPPDDAEEQLPDTEPLEGTFPISAAASSPSLAAGIPGREFRS
ncbi:MAG: phosphatase PAP2 family protein [Roseimicrobium sp.]